MTTSSRCRRAVSGAANSAAPLICFVVFLCICALQAWAFRMPQVGVLLQYDRAALASGEIWRLLSGHLVHWSAPHAGWDLFAAAILLWLFADGSCRARTGAYSLLLEGTLLLVISALAISLWLWLQHPQVLHYRGLSGLDSALFGAVATSLLLGGNRAQRRLALVASALFVGKVLWETRTGMGLFVPSGPPVVASAHWVGAAIGIAFAARTPRPPPSPVSERQASVSRLAQHPRRLRRGIVEDW